MKTAIVDVDADHVEKTCACNVCPGLRFVVSKTSKRIYYSSKHRQSAKDYRRKVLKAKAAP